MGRPPNTIPSRKLTLMLPGDVLQKMQGYLAGPDGKVPVGAQQRLITELLLKYFAEMAGVGHGEGEN